MNWRVSMSDNKTLFASTEEEALERYEKHKKVDPFPEVPPALLSTGQIQAYIAKAGMIYPYFPNSKTKKDKVKQATMTFTIGPEVLYWDKEEKRQYKGRDNLKNGDEIILLPNSITYLRPAERVNIPYYIAIRFNLRIKLVHRGLLLGTGPILDPGFKGYPMIPVHNLTDNEYRLQVGEDFINVEFTKIDISNEEKLKAIDGQEFSFKYFENSGKTFDYDFPQYIRKNVPQGKVKSSLSAVIDKASIAIKELEDSVKEKEEKTSFRTKVGIFAALLTFGALIFGGYQLVVTTNKIISDAGAKVEKQNIKLVGLEQQSKNLLNLEQKFQEKVEQLSNKITTLESRINTMANPAANKHTLHDVKVNFVPPTIEIQDNSNVPAKKTDKDATP